MVACRTDAPLYGQTGHAVSLDCLQSIQPLRPLARWTESAGLRPGTAERIYGQRILASALRAGLGCTLPLLIRHLVTIFGFRDGFFHTYQIWRNQYECQANVNLRQGSMAELW